MTSDENIRDIINKDIFALLNAEKLPDDQKAEIIEKAKEEISYRVFERLDTLLLHEEKKDFKVALESANPQVLSNFLEQKGIDIEKLTLDTALEYKATLVSMMQMMNQTAKIGAAINTTKGQSK